MSRLDFVIGTNRRQADWLFMAGLLGIGLALIVGIGLPFVKRNRWLI